MTTGSSESDAAHCSTALLTLTNNVGPFSYIACGKGPSTDVYMAFTTEASDTSAFLSSSTSSSVSTNTPQTTTASTEAPPTTSESRSVTVTNTAEEGVNSAPAAETQASSSTTNNTGPIIGGVVGCLALLCGFGIAALWLMRRNKAAKIQSSPTMTSNVADQSPPGFEKMDLAYGIGRVEVQEPNELGTGDWNPVELPATR